MPKKAGKQEKELNETICQTNTNKHENDDLTADGGLGQEVSCATLANMSLVLAMDRTNVSNSKRHVRICTHHHTHTHTT